MCFLFIFFFKQKTAYEMRISDWSSDVCSSDLVPSGARHPGLARPRAEADDDRREAAAAQHHQTWEHLPAHAADPRSACGTAEPLQTGDTLGLVASRSSVPSAPQRGHCRARGEARSYSVGNAARSEEHTSEHQYLMRIS